MRQFVIKKLGGKETGCVMECNHITPDCCSPSELEFLQEWRNQHAAKIQMQMRKHSKKSREWLILRALEKDLLEKDMRSVVVNKKPYGMHIRQGTLEVEGLSSGFPAARSGIKIGCELRSVASQSVSPDTWGDHFKKANTPFELRLACPKPPEPDDELTEL